MSRSRRMVGGLTFGYLRQGTVMLVGLWLTPFLLKYLGQHDYGLWLVGLQSLSYLMLMDFGVVALLPRETAYAVGHSATGNSAQELPATIGRTARIVLWQTPIVALAAAIVWLVVPLAPQVRGPVLVVLAGFTLLFPLRIFEATLQGLQEMTYLGKIQLLSWGLNTALMVVLVLLGFGLYALGISWVLSQLLPAALAFLRLRRSFPGVLPSGLPKLSIQEAFGSLGKGMWVSVAQIAQMLTLGSDYLIVGKVLGAAAVVPYSCTQKLIWVLGNQSHMIMEMASPGLSEMKTSASKDRIFRACAALTLSLLVTIGGLVCVFLAVNHSFVSWWIGNRQFGGGLLTALFGVSILLRQWNNTSVYSIFALGYERWISLTTLADGAINVVAGIGFAHWLGPIGVPLASILSVCLVSLPGNLVPLARELQVSPFKVVFAVWPWFWRFVIVSALSLIVGIRWWHASFLYVAALACATAAVYCSVMLPMIMNSYVRAYLPVQLTRVWDALVRRLSWTNAPVVAEAAQKNS
jgi:O-antigen/teichoic acid export membrane protein